MTKADIIIEQQAIRGSAVSIGHSHLGNFDIVFDKKEINGASVTTALNPVTDLQGHLTGYDAELSIGPATIEIDDISALNDLIDGLNDCHFLVSSAVKLGPLTAKFQDLGEFYDQLIALRDLWAEKIKAGFFARQ